MTTQLSHDLIQALVTTRDMMRIITELEADGWILEQQGISLFLRSECRDPRPLHDALTRLSPVLSDARLLGHWAGHQLEMEYIDGGFALADSSPGDLRDAFTGDELNLACDAWDGDVVAALGIAGSWTATAGIDPAQLLKSVEEAYRWYVLPSLKALHLIFVEHSWWDLKGLFEPHEDVVILVYDAPPDLELRTATLNICSLAADPQKLINSRPSIVESALPDITRSTGNAMVKMALPSTFALVPDRELAFGPGGAEIYIDLWRCCAATAWAWLATSVEINDGRSAVLEFFGLQRTRHELESSGLSIDVEQCRASYALWQWATNSDSPDQLLAARQVISLYRDAAPWSQAHDVRSAAEPVFVALRSDATAEAFRVQRETRELTLTVARETASATVDLAKGAIERCIASLAGLGGVIIAQTTKALTETQASKLHLLLGIFLIIMVGWSIFIEGPSVSVAIQNLPKDIGAFGELLSPGQRQQVLNLETLNKARKHNRVVRFAVPLAYGASAIAAFFLH